MGRVAGTVVAVRDGRAWVECMPEPSGCGACASGRGCGWRGQGTAPRLLDVPARLDGGLLAAGDSVVLEASDRVLLTAALRLYLLPLAGMLAGPLLVRLAGVDVGLVPALAALAGLVLGGLAARAWVHHGPALVLVSRAAS